MRRAIGAALLLVAVLGAAACSSSSPAAQSSQLPPSVAPTTVVTTPASSTPDSSTPASSTSSSAKPLSAFEKDPAVQALRAWAAQAAKTVNSGHYTDKALQALMTPDLAKTMKNILGGVVGQHFPGPIPFTPISVKRISAAERYVDFCMEAGGYALNRKTGRPAHKRLVRSIDGGAHLDHGVWKADALYTGKFSCKGIKIAEPSW